MVLKITEQVTSSQLTSHRPLFSNIVFFLWPWTLTITLTSEHDPYTIKVNQHAKGHFVQTHQLDCFMWTTKLVSNKTKRLCLSLSD